MNADKKDLEYLKGKYLRKNGWTKEVGSYHLFSLDGGKNWYAIEISGDEEKVIGPSEKVFPELLRELKRLDFLTKHVIKHGPINFQGADANQQIKMLEEAGFSVQKVF